MNISVFGLGYVGCVSVGCLAKNGHQVEGVDVSSFKVDLVNNGKPTILEKDIDTLMMQGWKNGMISATICADEAVLNTDISIVCVGTPSSHNGHLNLSYIFKTAEQIGKAIKQKDEFHTVVIRSTVLPGTNKMFGDIVETAAGKKRGEAFTVISNPEFLREGSAVKDYFNPAVTVIGGDHEPALMQVASLYENCHAPIEVTDIEVAELIKYVNNSFHALKVSFANEVGNICKALHIDSHKVMELFCRDTRLNISTAYFKPGYAYGGSCLPKDLKGLITLGHDSYLNTPVLSCVHQSNEYQKEVLFDMIESAGVRNVALVGLSFKEGTDDLRYSPAVDLAEKLIGKGYRIKIYDENVHLSKLLGANKAFVNERLPHLSELIDTDLATVIGESELVVVNHKGIDTSTYMDLLEQKAKVIDLVRVKELEQLPNYEGICW